MNATKLGLGLVLAGALSLGTAFAMDEQAAEYKPPKAVATPLVESPSASTPMVSRDREGARGATPPSAAITPGAPASCATSSTLDAWFGTGSTM